MDLSIPTTGWNTVDWIRREDMRDKTAGKGRVRRVEYSHYWLEYR